MLLIQQNAYTGGFTDAVSETFKMKFDDFFEKFYREDIDNIIISFPEKRSLKVDISNLEKFDPNLAYELIEKPDLIINAAEESLKQKIEGFGENQTKKDVHVRFFVFQVVGFMPPVFFRFRAASPSRMNRSRGS